MGFLAPQNSETLYTPAGRRQTRKPKVALGSGRIDVVVRWRRGFDEAGRRGGRMERKAGWSGGRQVVSRQLKPFFDASVDATLKHLVHPHQRGGLRKMRGLGKIG